MPRPKGSKNRKPSVRRKGVANAESISEAKAAVATQIEALTSEVNEAAAALKEMGYNVINPAAIDDAIPVECMSYEEIMRIDLELLSTADYLVQLPGWERSIGASRELGFALGTDKIIVSLEQLLTKEVMLS